RDRFGPDLPGELLDLGARHHPHEAPWHTLHARGGFVGPGQRRLTRRQRRRGQSVADDLRDRPVGLVQVGVGEVSGDAGKPLNSGDLFDARLYAAPLVALGDAVEDVFGFSRPLDLEAVKGFFILGAALSGGGRGDRGLVYRLEAGARAGRGFLRLFAPWRARAGAAG